MNILLGSGAEVFDKIRQNYLQNNHKVEMIFKHKTSIDAQSAIAIAERFILNASNHMFMTDFVFGLYYKVKIEIIGYNPSVVELSKGLQLMPQGIIEIFSTEDNYIHRTFFI